MMDRDKVIKGLELCGYMKGMPQCDSCPYDGKQCWKRLKNDALALLKAQEPVAVIPAIKKDGELLTNGNCPACGMKLDYYYNGNYCGCCGRLVKWE